MKTLICTIAIGVFASSSLMAQKISKIKVPEDAQNALKAKYPNATKVTWEKENGNYEANWGGKSGEDMSVQFTPAGVFVEQVKAISPKQLPQTTINYVKVHYKNSKITEAGKVTDAKGKISYEAEVKGKDMLFDEKGSFIRIE